MGLGCLAGTRAGRHDALHLERHGTLARDGRRGVGQARGHGDLRDLVTQRPLDCLEEALVLLGGLLGLLLLVLGGKVHVARRHVLEVECAVLHLGLGAVGDGLLRGLGGSLVLVVLGQALGGVAAHGLEGELVHVGRAEQYVIAVVERGLDHRHLGEAVARVAGGVVDGLLTLGHGLGVLGQRHELVLARTPEEQEVSQLVGLLAVALVDAELEAAAEALEELLVGVAVLVAHGLELGRDLLLDAVGDGVKLAVLLQRLARDVERDVRRVHDAAHEVVIIGQKVGALLHDEHVGAVEREALLVVLAVEVERRLGRHEQQRVVLERALGVEGDGARRVLPVVEGGLVELVVLLRLDVGLGLLPDRRHGVDGLELGVVLVLGLVVVGGVVGLGLLAALGDHHLDGMAHVVAVAADEVLERPLLEVQAIALALLAVRALHVVLEREDDVGAAVLARAVLDGVALEAVALPHVRHVLAPGARDDLDLLGHHEGRVEAHTELADDVDVVALVLGVGLLELLRAGVGDGAQVALELVGRHADAVVRDGEGAGVLVGCDADGEAVLVELDIRVGEALEVELVLGVGRVGDELAEEDLLVGVDRVDHEVEQLLALCLELAHVSLQTCYTQT